MTEVVYKPWENDSQHDTYETANMRRMGLFQEKIEGLQVKVKRTSEGKFIVKTRVPVPPKPVAKKKTPAKKAAPKKKTATTKRTVAKKTAQATTATSTPTPSKTTAKKRPAKKTSRKRK